MNPDQEFEFIETEFRQFKPAEPSPRLRRRMESAVSFPPLADTPGPETAHNVVRPPSSIWRRPWFQTAAAALVGAAAVFAFYNPDPIKTETAGTTGTGEVTDPIRGKLPPSPSVGSKGFQLAGQENRIFDSQDDGIVFSRDEIPFRRLRYNAVDRRIFRDPETGAIFELVVPREDILIVPAETF